MRLRIPMTVAALSLAFALAGCGSIPVPFAPPHRPGADARGERDFGSVEVYEVDERAQLSPSPADAATAEVWELFVRVVTPEVAAADVSRYRAVVSPDSDTLAYVYRTDDGPWVFAANLAFADDRDLLLSTLVHEYGHILSLSGDQVDPDALNCETWDTGEGCVLPTSTIRRFEEAFWTRYGSDAPAPDDNDPDAASAFYLDHEADFVSDYAATNVVEDFAESFMTFVLEEEPAGRAPAALKLRFFASLPEYTAIRERIRGEFGLD